MAAITNLQQQVGHMSIRSIMDRADPVQRLNVLLGDFCSSPYHCFERRHIQLITAAQSAILPTPAGAQRPKSHHEVWWREVARLEMCFCLCMHWANSIHGAPAFAAREPGPLDWTPSSRQPSGNTRQPLQFALKACEQLCGSLGLDEGRRSSVLLLLQW